MTQSAEWDRWCSAFCDEQTERWQRITAHDPRYADSLLLWIMTRPQPSIDAVRRFADPDAADLEWLSRALEDRRRRWFVGRLALDGTAVPEAILQPMLEAAVDADEPSMLSRHFIRPCVRTFGAERVRVGLLSLADSTMDARTVVGVLDALYSVDGGAEKDLFDRRRAFLVRALASGTCNEYVRRRLDGRLG